MSHDTWIHRLVRVGVRPLVRTPITPNQLTSLRLATGLAAAAAMAEGSETWLEWGAGVFLVSTLLDRADGELARLGRTTSEWGHKYDLISDALCNALVFVGLGIGLRHGFLGPWALLLGLLSGASIVSILWLVMKLEERFGQRAAELGGGAGFDPDDAMLIVPVLIWFGLAEWLIAAASIGAPIFAAYMYLRFRRGTGLR